MSDDSVKRVGYPIFLFKASDAPSLDLEDSFDHCTAVCGSGWTWTGRNVIRQSCPPASLKNMGRMTIKMLSIWTVAWIVSGIVCSAAGGSGQPKKLSAPGYYIAIDATREYEGLIRVRGASNLPVGAKISLEVEELVPENGRKSLGALTCATIGQKGLFHADLQVTKDVYQKKGLIIDAIFLPNQCVQNSEVTRVVGHQGSCSVMMAVR